MQIIRCLSPILLATAFLLAACDSSNPPTGPYAKSLNDNESVTAVDSVGPFTILHIHKRSPGWGSFHGTGSNFDRVLYGDKTLIEEALSTQSWDDVGRPAVLAYVYGDKRGPLKIVHERKGEAVVERINAPEVAWSLGEVIGPGLRFFETQSMTSEGFLLRAFPVEVIELPAGLSGLYVDSLAGFAPDFKSFAFTDSLDSPSVAVATDAKGNLGTPILLPMTHGVSPDASMSEKMLQTRSWFDSQFHWQRNARGGWDLARNAGGAPAGETDVVLEEPFLDAGTGYRNCFGNATLICQAGWQKVPDEHAFKPQQAVRAFGANVRKLWFSRTLTGLSYHLELDAAPDQIIREFRKRLEDKSIGHLEAGEITEERIASFLGPQQWEAFRLVPRDDESVSGLFVMPTVSVSIEAYERGTLVRTRARYPGPRTGG
jgi:hypothetical protein